LGGKKKEKKSIFFLNPIFQFMSLPNQKIGSLKMMMMIIFLIHFLQAQKLDFFSRSLFSGCGFARPKNRFLEIKVPFGNPIFFHFKKSFF
jgi:hypothetical protein